MSPTLEQLELVVEPAGGPLLPQVHQALAERLGPSAEALRWAITGLLPPATATGPARLTIEAVVLRLPL
jgi:hypothetical protein